MKTIADYASIKLGPNLLTFRYNTRFISDNGPGDIIGLVYMMNPGDAKPKCVDLYNKLTTEEICLENEDTECDTTMKIVQNFIGLAFDTNGKTLPPKYTILVENLFNLRKINSKIAQRTAINYLKFDNKNDIEKKIAEIMFYHRHLDSNYNFVWFAWGKVRKSILKPDITIYPNRIIVNTIKYKGKPKQINYPKHPIGMNVDFFVDASKGKILL
jgi:hypothetical protein